MQSLQKTIEADTNTEALRSQLRELALHTRIETLSEDASESVCDVCLIKELVKCVSWHARHGFHNYVTNKYSCHQKPYSEIGLTPHALSLGRLYFVNYTG